jgi:hypothetical protein
LCAIPQPLGPHARSDQCDATPRLDWPPATTFSGAQRVQRRLPMHADTRRRPPFPAHPPDFPKHNLLLVVSAPRRLRCDALAPAFTFAHGRHAVRDLCFAFKRPRPSDRGNHECSEGDYECHAQSADEAQEQAVEGHLAVSSAGLGVWSLTRFPGRFLCVDHAAISAAVCSAS